MNDKALAEHVKDLLRASGLSAFEAPARDVVAAAWKPHAPRQTISRLGSLHALQPGTGRNPRPKILLTAHMDMVGLMITQVAGGFCRITQIGGLDARILPGQAVVIHGRADVPAAVVLPPAALLPPDRKAEIPRLPDLWLDTGLPEAEAARLIRTGDTAAWPRLRFALKSSPPGLIAGT
jgi:putative aminopeptidase FrvX